MRRLLRRLLPAELRLRLRLLRRALDDYRKGTAFAARFGDPAGFPAQICCYRRPLIDYPGQQQVAAAKRRNQALLASHLSGVVIEPGETFSIWRLAPRPSRREGYGEAAALRQGALRLEVGGAICLLSTVVYNAALLGGLRVVERHGHSIDTYGARRYFELGRDAAIEYGYRDLRFRNPHGFAVYLRIEQSREALTARLYAARAAGFEVTIETLEPEHRQLQSGARIMRVKAFRTLRFPGGEAVTERLPDTLHRLPEGV